MENLHKAKRCTRPHRFLREESLGNQIFGRWDDKLDLCVHLIHVLTELRLGAATIGRFHNESLCARMPFLVSVIVQIIMPIAVNE